MNRAPTMVLVLCAVLLLAGCGAVPGRATPTAPVAPRALPGVAGGIRLIVEPDAGVQPTIRWIQGARRSLDLTMYLLTDRDVVAALLDAERKGVHVRVALEEHPYGEGTGNGGVYNQLRAGGVDARWANPAFTFTHAKYVVEDDASALISTANFTLSAFTKNREYTVVDDDPTDVRAIAAIFQADWDRTVPTLLDPHLVVSPANARSDFAALIAGANRSLDVESEEMQDGGIEDALGAAAQRGVSVRVVLSPAEPGQSDPNEPGLRRIEGRGAQVRLLRDPYVHAKIIVVDGTEAFIGSENISTNSIENNREVGLLLEDRQAIATLGTTFESDWAKGRPDR